MTARELEHLFKEMIKTTDECFHGAVSDQLTVKKKKCLSFNSHRHHRWQVMANEKLTLAVSLLASGSSMINRCKACSCNLILEISKNTNNYIFLNLCYNWFVLKSFLVSSFRNTATTAWLRLVCLDIY